MAAAGAEILVRRLALVVLLSGLLAGCGGTSGATKSPPPPPPGTRHLAAYVRSAAAKSTLGTSKAKFEVHMQGLQGIDDLTVRGSSSSDFARRRAQISLNAAGKTLEVVSDGSVFYMKGDLVGTEGWVKFDLDALTSAAPKSEADAIRNLRQQIDSSNPNQVFDYLKRMDNVTTVGTEKVRDVPTIHFRGTFDFTKGLDAFPEETQRTLAQAFGHEGLVAAPLDAWIDGQGRARRVVAQLGSPDSAELKVEAEDYDYDVPVEIAVPSGSDVIDLTNLAGGNG